ncbi:GumC family protein [Azospirillum sp. Marseille-Q6669]
MLNQVVNDLQLAQHPEFNPPAQEDETLPLVERAVAYGRDLASRFWDGAPPAPVAWLLSHGDEVAQDIRAREAHAALGNDQIIARIHRKLDVAIVGRSRVIQVRFTSKEPQLSRDVVDGIVRRYMETRQQMDRDLSTSAISWLQDRIVLLRREVAEADSKVEEARVKGGLLKGGTGLMAQNELEQTRLRLSEASAIRARSVAQADTLERNLKAGNWNAIGGSIASPVVAQLRATVAAISTEMAQLSRQYGPKHPRIVELQGRLNEANSSLQQEIRREINGVREAAQVAVEQETALRSMITRMEGSYATMQEQAIPLRTLESEATAKRQLLDSLLGRLEEVEAQKDSRAFPAAVSWSPRRRCRTSRRVPSASSCCWPASSPPSRWPSSASSVWSFSSAASTPRTPCAASWASAPSTSCRTTATAGPRAGSTRSSSATPSRCSANPCAPCSATICRISVRSVRWR